MLDGSTLHNKMSRFFYFIVLFLGLSINTFGQRNATDSVDHINYFSADFAYHFPQYDMKTWFNNSATIGASYGLKTDHNWTFTFDFSYLWGDHINNQDSVIWNIADADGNIVDGNGQLAVINYSESGWSGMASVGKVFPLNKNNQNSGIWVKAGIGFLQHKILISNPNNVTPQIKDDYKKGYDQLSNGFACNQFIGYFWISKRSMINAYAGFEAIEGWTKLRRTVDFNTGLPDNTRKFDLLIGFKIGAVIPIFKRRPESFYIN